MYIQSSAIYLYNFFKPSHEAPGGPLAEVTSQASIKASNEPAPNDYSSSPAMWCAYAHPNNSRTKINNLEFKVAATHMFVSSSILSCDLFSLPFLKRKGGGGGGNKMKGEGCGMERKITEILGGVPEYKFEPADAGLVNTRSHYLTN